MNEEEQGLEQAKEGVKQLLEPVTDIIKSLLGPAAAEIGLAWGDSLRLWRLKRIVRLLEDVRQITSDAGLQLKPVAPRILFPLLESASLQDDEDLHQRWVALLTNAARSDFEGEILPCFPDILKQLTSEEAQFIDRAYDEVTRDAERRRTEILSENPEFHGTDVGFLGLSGGIIRSVHPVLIENMERLMLVTRTRVPLSVGNKIVNTMPPANHLYVSELGKIFVRACRVSKTVD